jgi:hypothetical protein
MEGMELKRERKLMQYLLLIIFFFAAIFAFHRAYHIYGTQNSRGKIKKELHSSLSP